MPMFSAASLFSAYASVTAIFTLIEQFYHQFVPKQVRSYINRKLEEWFTKTGSSNSLFTLIIEQFDDGDYELTNQVYHACATYLSSKLRATARQLKVSRPSKKDYLSFKLVDGEKYSEQFQGVQLHWRFISNNSSANNAEDSNSMQPRNKHFELSVNPEHKDILFDSYLPLVLQFHDDTTEKKKELRLYSHEGGLSKCWKSVKFKHPFTFDALALDPEMKRAVIDDLDRFLRRKEFYKKVGRAWKRGYLLYGPPGTGKSSLIAAMANYLKFDIYDLQLSTVHNDSVLRRLLLSTTNQSILVIEDIDCSLGSAVHQRHFDDGSDGHGNDIDKGGQISLSGLLNFIDGLWSSCGDERIIIFTTNYKDKLDPALLRPGRMDMHIHMSYLTMPAFRVLASNYLGVSGDHSLFGKVEQLIQAARVTPAQVAEELIRSDDVHVAFSNLVEMLKQNKVEQSRKERTEEMSLVGNDNGEAIEEGDLSDELEVVNDEHCLKDSV